MSLLATLIPISSSNRCQRCRGKGHRRIGLIHHGGRLLCRDCKDRLFPVCPRCNHFLGSLALPRVRSLFLCPQCLHKIYAIPDQHIFPSAYVSHSHARLIHYLDQLNMWSFTVGSEDDFFWAKQQTGHDNQSNQDRIVVEAIAYLMRYNLEQVARINPEASEEALRVFRLEIQHLNAHFWHDVHSMAGDVRPDGNHAHHQAVGI